MKNISEFLLSHGQFDAIIRTNFPKTGHNIEWG